MLDAKPNIPGLPGVHFKATQETAVMQTAVRQYWLAHREAQDFPGCLSTNLCKNLCKASRYPFNSGPYIVFKLPAWSFSTLAPGCL